MEASWAPHSTGPRHAGQQGTTQHSTRSCTRAGSMTKHECQQGTTQNWTRTLRPTQDNNSHDRTWRPAGNDTAMDQDTQARRAPHGTGAGLAGQQFHKPQDQGHDCQQMTTQQMTRTHNPAGHHTAQDKDLQASLGTQHWTRTHSKAGHHTAQDQRH